MSRIAYGKPSCFPSLVLLVFAWSVFNSRHAQASAVVRSAAGANPAAIQTTVDQFRADLGGGTTPGANGSFGTPSLRREINWDGVPALQSSPNAFPVDFFNTTSPRGILFSTPTPGTGFQVSAASGGATAVRFGNIDASYTSNFQTFSPEKLFTPIGNNITDVTFTLPGSSAQTTVTGFGAVFSDVDNDNQTFMRFFDAANQSLGVFVVPSSGNGLSFVGVSFTTETVAKVRIVTGNKPLASGNVDNPPTVDVVALDDFIYGEPHTQPELLGLKLDLTAGTLFTGSVANLTIPATTFTASASIDWGDGTVTSAVEGVSDGVGLEFTASHAYTQSGNFTTTITASFTLNGGEQQFLTTTGLARVFPEPSNVLLPQGNMQTFSGVGGTNTSGGALTAFNAFKAAIGGVDNGAAGVPASGGFRTINWDGVGLGQTDGTFVNEVIVPNHSVGIPLNRFQARGVFFADIYAVTDDVFASISPAFATLFAPFSPAKTFAMFNDNGIELDFVVPSSPTTVPLRGATRGFGCIFVDVETPNTTSIAYFNGPNLLATVFCPTSVTHKDPEFIGVVFDNPVVTRVEITVGSGTLFSFNGLDITNIGTEVLPGTDLAVTDDFAYAEPIPLLPLITSAVNATGTAGTPFTFTPTAIGLGTISFSSSSLPPGLTLSGSTITGTPLAVGTFVVTLTATGAQGSASQALTFTIGPKPSPGGSLSNTDSDGDGFPDELETALGTDPNSALSTPANNLPFTTPEVSENIKLSVKLDFAHPGTNDSIQASGGLPIPDFTIISGSKLTLDIGGIILPYVLSASGTGTFGKSSIKLKFKASKIGPLAAQSAVFSMKLSKGNVAASLVDEGLTNANVSGVNVTIPVLVVFNNTLYREDVHLSYSAKVGKSGSTKTAKVVATK